MATPVIQKPGFWLRLPLIRQLRQSVGWQRGMLIAGLVIRLDRFQLIGACGATTVTFGITRCSSKRGSTPSP